MTALARRLDPCLNWFRLLSVTQGRVLWAFPTLLLIGWIGAVRWPDAASALLDRAFERSRNSPALTEARRLNLDYDAVSANPTAYAGKPVAWCVDRPAADTAYVDGRPSQPVKVDGNFSDFMTSSSSGGYCRRVLATVQPSAPGFVSLHIVEAL